MLFLAPGRSYKDRGSRGRVPRVMKILFVTSTRVGDAVLSTGLLDHVIERHPDARVTVACGPAAAGLFEAVPGLERIIVMDKMLGSLHWVRMWSLCVGRFWDMVLDLRNTPLSYLLAARRHHHMHRTRESGHRVVQLARVMGLGEDPPTPRIWTNGEHAEAARDMIPDGPPVLALGPTANWLAKTWPAEHFAQLAARLTGEGGLLAGGRVALFGRADERPGALALIEAIPDERRLDLIGRAGLLEVFACMGRCALYVGNDSGLMHMAAASGIPTLGLFGPSEEESYGPWGAHCETVRADKSYDDIFPEGFDHRNSGTLMAALSVERVTETASELWRRTGGAAA